jgi:hypothetical protein
MHNQVMTTCIFCGLATPDSSAFCRNCGRPTRALRPTVAGANQFGRNPGQTAQGLLKNRLILWVVLPVLLLSLLAAVAAIVLRSGPKKAEAQLPTVLSSADNRLQIMVPGGWRQDPSLYLEAQLQASDKERDLHLVVHTVSKATRYGLESDLRLEKSAQTAPAFFDRDSCSEVIAPVQLRINRHPALQREIRARYLGREVGALHTVVETPTHFQEITAWTSPSLFASHRPSFAEMAESVDEFDTSKKYSVEYQVFLQGRDGELLKTIKFVTDKLSLKVRVGEVYSDTAHAGGLQASFTLNVGRLPETLAINGFAFTVTEKTLRAEDRSWDLQADRYTIIDMDRLMSRDSLNAPGGQNRQTTR